MQIYDDDMGWPGSVNIEVRVTKDVEAVMRTSKLKVRVWRISTLVMAGCNGHMSHALRCDPRPFSIPTEAASKSSPSFSILTEFLQHA